MKLKHIPNILSFFRLCLVPVFVFLFFKDYPQNTTAALIVFFLAGVTDVVDGYLARHFNWISDIGKILDPLADKLMQCTVLICLYTKEILPLVIIVPFILKEALMLIGGIFIFKKENKVVVSSWFGKLAVCTFYAAVFVVIVFGEDLKNWVLYTVCGFALAVTLAALILYIMKYINFSNVFSIKNSASNLNERNNS